MKQCVFCTFIVPKGKQDKCFFCGQAARNRRLYGVSYYRIVNEVRGLKQYYEFGIGIPACKKCKRSNIESYPPVAILKKYGFENTIGKAMETACQRAGSSRIKDEWETVEDSFWKDISCLPEEEYQVGRDV